MLIFIVSFINLRLASMRTGHANLLCIFHRLARVIHAQERCGSLVMRCADKAELKNPYGGGFATLLRQPLRTSFGILSAPSMLVSMRSSFLKSPGTGSGNDTAA